MRPSLLGAAIAGMLCGAVMAQAPRTPEPLSAWQFYKVIQVPSGTQAGMLDFLLDREMLDQTRADHADVRIYHDAVEIPYVLRVRREVDTQEAFSAREFNRSVSEGVAQGSYDLGEQPQEHNQIDIVTGGNNFRRLADVDGSADGAHWSTLVSGAILFRFGAAGRTAEERSVTYPVSRYRYLRVRVTRDPQVDRGAPELTGVQIRRAVHRKGEMLSLPASLLGRDPDRVNGRPASVWRLNLEGRIPFERLMVTVNEGTFSRPFELTSIDDPSLPTLIASGELVRREGASPESAISFAEQRARMLKLVVTDDRNPPLAIYNVVVQSAARQLIFEAATVPAGAIRVYYGNPKAAAPHYDLESRVPLDLAVAPVRLSPQEQHENPSYTPGERPFSERAPWVVYLVLGTAAVVLAWILLGLVKQSARRVTA